METLDKGNGKDEGEEGIRKWKGWLHEPALWTRLSGNWGCGMMSLIPEHRASKWRCWMQNPGLSASLSLDSLPLLHRTLPLPIWAETRNLRNKRPFLKQNKKPQLWAAFFWFLLRPSCFLHPCVLPSGRLGVDREIWDWRWRFANHPTGCLIKCKSRRGEKRSSLPFSLQIKCYVPLAGIRSAMLRLHLLFLTAPQRALLLLFCKPASCSWRVQKETCCRKKKKKSLSDKQEGIQNLLEKKTKS